MHFLSKIDVRILWAVKILLGLCLLTPLLMSSSLLFPYTSAKAFAFRILIELALVGYFYLALKYAWLRPRQTILGWAVALFLAVYLLSAVLGADWSLSWWGGLDRMMGGWGLIHFVLFFVMLSAVFRAEDDWRALLGLAVGAGTVVALLAIGQRVADLGVLLPQSERVFSLIGNAGFLASFLVFIIGLTVWLLLFPGAGQRRQLVRINCGLALFLQLVALLLTGTRGALVGLAAGVLVFLILTAVWPVNKNWRRNSLIGLAVAVLLFGVVFLARDSAAVKNNDWLFRLTTISLNSTTAQSRLVLWQDSWQAWRARPWLGFGPENFEAAVGRYLSPELTSLENYSLDRAHNFIFDYGTTSGWLGLLSYLGLFVSAGWCLFKIARHQAGQRLGAMVLGSLLVGYLGQNFFIFDTFISYLMLFFVLSFINFRCVPSAEKEMEKTLNKIKNILSIKYFVLVFTVSCLLLAVYFFNIKPTLASYRANQLLSLSPASADQSGVLLKDILSLKTFGSPEIVYQATIDYIIKIDQAPVLSQNEDFYKVTADALRQTIKQAPGQARNYIALAWLDLYFSNQQPGRLDEALVLAGQARELIPNKKDAYLVLAADYALRGDKQQGQQVVAQAQLVSPVIGQEVKEYWESLR